MRHFLPIARGIDVVPIQNALAQRPDLWNEHTLRTDHPQSPHREVDDVWLMFNRIPENAAELVDDCEVFPYRAWHELPVIRPLVLDLMRRVEGVRLGRCIITRLAPGRTIPEHVDEGAPATYYRRYHLALQSQPGALNHSGGEVCTYEPGDFVWFDNCAPHSVVNNSGDDRIVLVMDVRPC